MRLSGTLFNVQTTNSSLISVKNLSKVYGKKENSFKALKGVSLTINKGDSFKQLLGRVALANLH